MNSSRDAPPVKPGERSAARLAGVDVEGNISAYMSDRGGTARYSSFDYCFNYFRSHFERDAVPTLTQAPNLEVSCLQLAFYLASWGMFRGRSQLLQRSARYYETALQVIVESPREVWSIDVDDYSSDARATILETSGRVRRALEDKASDTLTSKIMLGVFGCVPAFDRYFKSGFGATTFSDGSLRRIGDFYREHASVIEAARAPTLDFQTGGQTKWRYTGAKVVDMVFFIEGLRNSGGE